MVDWKRIVEKAREFLAHSRSAPRSRTIVEAERVIEQGIASHSEAVVSAGLARLHHEAELGQRVTLARQAGARVRKSIGPVETLEHDAAIAERSGNTARAADLRQRARIIREREAQQARESGLVRSEVGQVTLPPEPIGSPSVVMPAEPYPVARRPEVILGTLAEESRAAMRRMRERFVRPARPRSGPLPGEGMGIWYPVSVKFGATAKYRATPHGYQWVVVGPRGVKQGIGPFGEMMPLDEAARSVGEPMLETIFSKVRWRSLR